jgi:hypothetical protein
MLCLLSSLSGKHHTCVLLRERELISRAFPEAFWAFDCALVLWAIVKYGGDRLRATGPRPALFAANCKPHFPFCQ